MADALRPGGCDHPPPRVWRRAEPADDVVIAPEQLRRFHDVSIGEDRVGQRGERARVSLSFDELEDLASARISAEDPRRIETSALEIAQQGVHRGRPRSSATTDGVADAHRVVEISPERSLFDHRRSVWRQRALTATDHHDEETAVAGNCGDGVGSNSPSKALDRIAPTSVVGDLQSRGPGRAPTRCRSRQPVIFGPRTGRSADRSPANFALPGPRGGDREDAH